jgi:hypothetical protein
MSRLPTRREAPNASALERSMVSGFSELPACRCGKEMRIANINPLPESTDTHIRIYDCPACDHQLRLTVWGSDALS